MIRSALLYRLRISQPIFMKIPVPCRLNHSSSLVSISLAAILSPNVLGQFGLK